MSLDSCSSSLAALGEALFQDPSFGSVPVGSEPKLHDFDALLTTDSLGLDKLSLPYLSGGVPAFLARPFQLSAFVIVARPIINPAAGCCGCRLSMSYRMMTGQSRSPLCGVPPRCPEKSSLGNLALLESYGKLEISLR